MDCLALNLNGFCLNATLRMDYVICVPLYSKRLSIWWSFYNTKLVTQNQNCLPNVMQEYMSGSLQNLKQYLTPRSEWKRSNTEMCRERGKNRRTVMKLKGQKIEMASLDGRSWQGFTIDRNLGYLYKNWCHSAGLLWTSIFMFLPPFCLRATWSWIMWKN